MGVSFDSERGTVSTQALDFLFRFGLIKIESAVHCGVLLPKEFDTLYGNHILWEFVNHFWLASVEQKSENLLWQAVIN